MRCGHSRLAIRLGLEGGRLGRVEDGVEFKWEQSSYTEIDINATGSTSKKSGLCTERNVIGILGKECL